MTDTNIAPALLPCPMCGGMANDTSHHSCDCCGKDYTGEVACIECSCSVRHYDTRDEARAAWNRRTTPATDAGEREAEMIEALAVHLWNLDTDCNSDASMFINDAERIIALLAPYHATERTTEYARGLADGVKQSEAAIVAWLRSLKTAVDVAMSDVLAGPRPDEGKSLTGRAREVIGCVSLALPIAAFSIERREHAQEAGNER